MRKLSNVRTEQIIHQPQLFTEYLQACLEISKGKTSLPSGNLCSNC